ncbi:MAG TPA: hypothetical protein VMG12_10625 [Polyangiaceae bacterium]|nr:hypothetical protein [Polyangiaceae bacterium]
MSNGRTRWRVLGIAVQLGTVALLGGAWSGCGDVTPESDSMVQSPPASGVLEEENPSEENGQTGSTEPPDCTPGVEVEISAYGPCGVDLEAWTRPIGHAALMQARCMHPFSDALPVCECKLHLARLAGDERPWEGGSDEVVAYPGGRPGSCSVYARTPSGCLYCGSEFPGCSIDDPHSCDAVCAETADRYDVELQKAFPGRLRRLSCASDYTCEFVTEIDGACYARNPREKGIPAFDCALSDEQLLERKGERDEFCPERPPVACETATDCPRGLACDDRGTCVSCSTLCNRLDEDCAFCAQGELCIEAVCVPAANVACRSSFDCEPMSTCVLSGMDPSSGRGNAQTRSLCQVYNPIP